MGHTNDEESDFEGYKLKDIVTDEESGVDLNNENILCQFDFFFYFDFFRQFVSDITTKKWGYFCTAVFEGYSQQCFN